MKIEEATKKTEETIQEIEKSFAQCSLNFQNKLTELKKTLELAITALRSMPEAGEPIDSPTAHIDRIKWISVKEQLPENYLDVLVFDAFDRNMLVSYMNDEGEWAFYGYRSIDFTVTHWMPLPEPPEEE